MKIFVLILTIICLAYLAACTKMTGGGWLYDVEGDRVSFGFNAQPVEEPTEECDVFNPPCVEAKGRFNLVDHGDVSGERRHIRGRFTGTFNAENPLLCEETANTPCASRFDGDAMIDGEDYMFFLRVTDNGEGANMIGDFVEIQLIHIGSGDLINYIGTIEGGNLQVHL